MRSAWHADARGRRASAATAATQTIPDLTIVARRLRELVVDELRRTPAPVSTAGVQSFFSIASAQALVLSAP